MSGTRVALVADTTRDGVMDVLKQVEDALLKNGAVIEQMAPGAELTESADLAVVLGGDGTILAQGRSFLQKQLPIAGVNVGRLGFLAEFDAESFTRHAERILSEERPIRDRMTMEVSIQRAGDAEGIWHPAVNDCVVTAGPPFRMIELRIEFDGLEGPRLTGDGVVVATPTGSTAYNVSAGGPIVHPECEAFALTPIAAHSLAFRPVVASPNAPLGIEVVRANEGTTLVLDGQSTWKLADGDRVRIRRGTHRLRLLHDPEREFWDTVTSKMRWASGPSYRDR